MAEEFPISEDAGESSLMSGQLSLPNAESFPDLLAAKPVAMNPYYNIVGNPQKGSNPGATDNPLSFAESLARKFESTTPKANPYYSLQPFTYSGDSDANLFERYHSTGDVYDKLGFSPYRNNEELYNKNMTLGNEFVRAAKQWDDLVGVGFMSGVRSWNTLFTDPLSPDLKGAEDMKHIMAVGSSGKGGIGGFFINTFLNSGYTVGIGADFLAEELALAGVTALTGGSGGGAMIGKGLSAVNKLFDFSKLKTGAKGADVASDVLRAEREVNNLAGMHEMGDDFNKVRGFWNKIGQGAMGAVKGTANILNPLDNTLAALKATDYATNYAKTVKTFGAFADDLLMVKGAVSEAKLEGGMVKIDVNEKLIDEYRAANDGKNPEGEDLKTIEKLAHDAAYKTAFWNMPAIMTSNKLMYATMLAPLRRMMGREVQELIPAIVFENKAFREVGEGMADRAKIAIKSLKKPKLYGQFGMNYLKANFAEGIQENLQEAISQGAIAEAEATYRDPIKGAYEGYMPHFMKGLKSQLSAQGAETFAGGFVMGMFAQPVMAAPSLAISKIANATVNREKIEAFKEARKKELHGYDKEDGTHVMGTLEYLNELVKDENGNVNLDIIAPDIINAVRTGRLANDMFTAARLGDKKGTLDSRDALQNHHLMTAIRTGKLDVVLDRLKDYKNLSKDEAKQAFAKYGITEEEDINKALAQIDGVIARAKDVQETYLEAANRYPNPINMRDYRKQDPIAKMAAMATKKAWDDAVYQLVFAKATFKDYSKRIADISNTFSAISNALAQGDAQSLMNLLTTQGVTDEINILRREIDVLDEKDPEQKKRKQDKTARLEKIQKFYDEMKATKFAKSEDEGTIAHGRAKEAFGEYIQHLAGKTGTLVFTDQLDEAYTLVKDHLLLKDEMRGLANSINVLMAPKSFLAIHEKLTRAVLRGFQMMPDTLAGNAEQFTFDKDLNQILSSIEQDPGVRVPQELYEAAVEAWKTKQPWPKVTHFLDLADDTIKITEGEKFDAALDKWNVFMVLHQSEVGEDEEQAFDRDDISTYSDDLLEQLRISYNSDLYDDDYRTRVSFQEFAIAPEQVAIRTAYFEDYSANRLKIPVEWKNLSVDALEELQKKYSLEAETDPKLDETVSKLQDYIAVKLMRDSGMTPEKKQALANLKVLTNNAEGIKKNEQGYWINGKYTDLRISNLIYDTILPKHYEKESIPFADKAGNKNMISKAEAIFKKAKAENMDTAAVINEWAAGEAGNSVFTSRFDDYKVALIKKELGDSLDFEEFKKVINRQAYSESFAAGNTVDELIRDFISYGAMTKPANMDQAAFEELRAQLRTFMKTLLDRGETVIAKNLIVHGKAIVDGKEMTIGGEMDLVVVTPQGELKIYDIKTGKKWDYYGTDKDDFKKKEGYQLQLSLYANLLENATGLKVNTDALKIIPFQITVKLDGSITSLKLANDPKNYKLEYDPISLEYIPLNKKGDTATNVITGTVTPATTTVTTTETKDTRKTLPVTIEELQDQEVDWQGMTGTIRIYGPDNIVFETENVEYEVEGADISSNPTDFGFEGIMVREPLASRMVNKYAVENVTEDSVTVNDVDYIINTDELGNIESLSPTNQPSQKITNEKLVIAVEVERNKLEYNTPKDEIDEVFEIRGSNGTTTIIEGIYNENFTDTIAEGLDKLYEGTKMTEQEKLQVELWAFDALDKIMALQDRDQYKTNEEVANAFNNLRQIINTLHGEQSTKRQKGSTEETDVPKPTKKGKRRITKASSTKQKAEVKKKAKKLETSTNPKIADINKRKAAAYASLKPSGPEGSSMTGMAESPKGKWVILDDSKMDVGEVINQLYGEELVFASATTIASSRPVGKVSVVKVLTLQDINNNKTLDNLKEAKKKKYEVVYDNTNYKILRVGKKSVTLSAPNLPNINILEEDFSEIIVVEPGGIKSTDEDNTVIKKDEKTGTSKEKDFSIKPVAQSFKNVIDAAKKC